MKTCYMCDNEATSREHVPPKCVFPEKKDLPKTFDFRKNLIGVPSCDIHNSKKSKDDEYFNFILSTGFLGNEHKHRHFETKIIRAIQRRPQAYSRFMKELTPVQLALQDGSIEDSAYFTVDMERFNSIATHLAHGIYYHHYEKRLIGSVKVFTNAITELKGDSLSTTNAKIIEVQNNISKAFRSRSHYGSNKQIFTYRLISDIIGRHVVNMVFFEGVEITALMESA